MKKKEHLYNMCMTLEFRAIVGHVTFNQQKITCLKSSCGEHSYQSIHKHNLKGFTDIFAKHDSKTSLEFCIICGTRMTIIANRGMLNVQLLLQGSYRQVCVKSKDFSGLLKDLLFSRVVNL